MFNILLKNTTGRVPLMKQKSKKVLVEVNPPQRFSYASRSCEQMKKRVTDKYFEEKVRL